MAIFKLSPLGIAILSVACGANVDDGNSTTDNGGAIGSMMSAGGSQNGGTATAAAGSTQVNVVTPSGTGGTTGSNYTGGLTPITYDPAIPLLNLVVPNAQIFCGWEIGASSQSSCAFSVRVRIGGYDNSVSIQVIYSVATSTSDSFLVGQSQPDCSQGDGWYFDTDGNITLCPQTCTSVQQDPTFVISIVVGCQSNSDCPCSDIPE